MTEHLTLSSSGLTLSPSLVFLSTELSAVVTMVALLCLHTAALSSVCESFRGRGHSLMAGQKKKVYVCVCVCRGDFLFLKQHGWL